MPFAVSHRPYFLGGNQVIINSRLLPGYVWSIIPQPVHMADSDIDGLFPVESMYEAAVKDDLGNWTILIDYTTYENACRHVLTSLSDCANTKSLALALQ